MWRCTILVVLMASAASASADVRFDLTPEAPGDHRAIVGGSDVPPGKWPDTVAVLGDSGVCTGTLIAPDVVLTAGHCADINPRTVIANTVDYSRAGGVRVRTSRTVAFPSWERSFDVAVVVLAEPITTVTPRRVGTGCTFNQFTSNTMVRLVGFGATSMDGRAQNTLLKEAMTAVLDPTCASGNGCEASIAPGGEFIAGGTGSADSCFGDSGGPVYLETSRGPILVGAVSRGVDNAATPCGGGGIYVRTDKIIAWIEEVAGTTIEKDTCAANPDDIDDNGMGTGEHGDLDADVVGGCSITGSGSGASTGALVLLGLAFASARRRRRGRTLD
jgi:MYXO-CTERM domain-containing protein